MKRWIPIVFLLVAATVSAQGSVPFREIRVSWTKGTPRVSFSAKDLADERVRKELESALRKRLVVTVSARPSGSGRTIVRRQFSCDVTRDLWDDGYLVRIASRTDRLSTLDAALNRCLVVKGLFVGDDAERFAPYQGTEIFFLVTAEFNPISEKQCRELIGPGGGDDPIGPITMSIVRRRICRAERTVQFRGKDVEVPK